MEASKSSFGLVSSTLLEKIDRLFACNAGEYVDLPQLVVVGDQSSGKSSVLVALTDLPFPRDSGLCTRFATQITFRRCPETRIAVSIIPAKNCTQEHKERVQAWTKTGLQTLDAISFANMMIEVKNIMGVESTGGGPKTTFSEDVLRLEICGPTQEHFSVIDVPGIFKRTTQGITTKADISMVDDMVYGYMRNPRSVMLTVIPCNVDIATQEILERAEEVDLDGIRTLGVLTKPDLVDKGAEPAVLDLIEGRRHQLQLGWHLLRNPGQAGLVHSTRSRHAIEKEFFAKESPWNRLEEEKVGVDSLRTRLQEILAGHIRREFPKVKSEINHKLKTSSRSLEALGPRRQTQVEQNRFVMEVALEFQRITTLAVRSDYSRTDLFDKCPSLRIATAAVNRGETFANVMDTNGHYFDFSPDHQGEISEQSDLDTEALGNLNIDDAGAVNIRTEPDHPDIEDLMHKNIILPEPFHGSMLGWLKNLYHQSRGFELGTFHASLLAVTMKRQSVRWRDLALGYISDIIAMVHAFVKDLLRHITPNENMRIGIESLLMDDLTDKYQTAMAHVNFLLDVELEGTPATYNDYFNDTLEECRRNRLRLNLADKSLSGCKHGTVVPLNDIAQNHPLSTADHVIQEIHDILLSYYELAQKRFVDCVRMQVADYFLVTGSKTPLTLFSPAFVAEMTPEQLEEVAGEDVAVKRRRAQLEKEIKQLEESRKILS